MDEVKTDPNTEATMTEVAEPNSKRPDNPGADEAGSGSRPV
jgi:hypothetical protein